jgi:hypothetical protein
MHFPVNVNTGFEKVGVIVFVAKWLKIDIDETDYCYHK